MVSNFQYVPYVCTNIAYSKEKDQPGKVANPVRGQLNKEKYFSLSLFAPENSVSRDEFGSLSRPASVCSSPYSG